MTKIMRFAPSPTGSMHLGNARTALFNYLYAKSVGGKMLLRIEDTDRERSTDESIKSIFNDLDWLGITWDGDAVMQSDNISRHAEIANTLLEEGKAYRCYCTSEELAEMRELAQKEGRTPKYDGRWRDRVAGSDEEGKAFTVRIKAPTEGSIVINDHIKGTIEVKCEDLDDMIIMRSDGTPVYQLAVVVDDHDMGVNYIIRGDDHMTNTFRQAMIYAAMGWDIPEFAHLPMIFGPDGKKLSKRHGSSSVEDIRNDGILPDALCNYMLRLGFSKGNEIISRNDVISIFDIEDVNSSAARFDYKKLENMNGIYIRNTDDVDLINMIKPMLINKGFNWTDYDTRVEILMPTLKERSSDLNHLVDSTLFLDDSYFLENDANGDLTYKFTDEANKFIEKHGDSVEAILSEFIDREDMWQDFDPALIKEMLTDISDENELKMKIVGQAVRIGLTFSTMSPPISNVIEALGISSTIERVSIVQEIAAGL